MLHVVTEVLFLIHFAHSTLAEVVDMVDQARASDHVCYTSFPYIASSLIYLYIYIYRRTKALLMYTIYIYRRANSKALLYLIGE